MTIEPDWLSEHVGVLPDDCVRIDPEVWAQMAGYIERRGWIRNLSMKVRHFFVTVKLRSPRAC